MILISQSAYFCPMTSVEKKAPYPFKKIAVAVAFSPRVEAILAESKRLQDIFGATMIFIHVGEKNLQQEEYLKHLLHRFELDKPENKLLWETGDPVEVIIDKCKEHAVDLVVAGALEKESLFKYFLGSVARKLSRRAKCSVLMLREPDIMSKPVKKIVVEGSDHAKTVNTVETAVYLAKQTHAGDVTIVQESDVSKMALIRSDELSDNEAEERKEKIFEEENVKLDEILKCADCGNMQINIERLDDKPGYVITQYAREHKADVLVLNSPDTKLNLIDRVFPHDIEYALADLPCDLLIVHSRMDEEATA
jgi:nucleotide-binding universal stress UspA family protein/predicted  nucleic acid-binding Zn-ribbon protein